MEQSSTLSTNRAVDSRGTDTRAATLYTAHHNPSIQLWQLGSTRRHLGRRSDTQEIIHQQTRVRCPYLLKGKNNPKDWTLPETQLFPA